MTRESLSTGDPARQFPREHGAGHGIANCKYDGAVVTAPDTSRCARPTLPDPTSLAPILLTIAAGVLILTGGLTLANRGPALLFRQRSRSRRETRRLMQKRRVAGLVLIGTGVGSLVLMVILALND